LIARGREQNMITRQCIAGSTSSATEIRKRVASGQSIRYFVPRSVEELLAAKNFTRSKRNNRRTVSENLCGTRLEQKGGRDYCSGFAFDLDVYRFLRDLLSHIEPQLKAIANEIETRLKEDHGIRPSTIDGFPGSQWIVLDYLQVVVHVFSPRPTFLLQPGGSLG